MRTFVRCAFLAVASAPIWTGDARANCGKMYWSEATPQKIFRANLDGTAIKELVTGIFARGIALDTAGGMIY